MPPTFPFYQHPPSSDIEISPVGEEKQSVIFIHGKLCKKGLLSFWITAAYILDRSCFTCNSLPFIHTCSYSLADQLAQQLELP